jgi:protein-disulfide isomerase
MKRSQTISNVAIVAVAAAVTAAGTSYLSSRYMSAGRDMPAVAVERIAHGYLTKNPEILVAISSELEQRHAAEQQEQQDDGQKQKTISDNADAIFRSPTSYVAGNPNGDVSLVEFFDYNCGYCRRALPDVLKLVNDDGKLRLVLKELPIFGDDSLAAAKLAIASNKQGKYFEMHQRLFSEPGRAGADKALRIARELGLDVDRLQSDAENPDIKKTLDETQALARKLAGSPLSTPYYLIGDQVVDSVSENFLDQLKAKVAEVRTKGCAGTC